MWRRAHLSHRIPPPPPPPQPGESMSTVQTTTHGMARSVEMPASASVRRRLGREPAHHEGGKARMGDGAVWGARGGLCDEAGGQE